MKNYIYLCDGQGGVAPGKGEDLYKTNSVFKKAFDYVNSFFYIDVKELSWGSLRFKTKDDPHYAHIYSFCNQYALFEYLKYNDHHCSIITGHSLGEIIALILSGAVDLETGAQWINFRGELFKKNMELKSEMVALIGNRQDALQCIDYCNKRAQIYIANYNSKNQIVISIKKGDLGIVFEEALKKAIRPINLNLGNGCHSIFVQPIEHDLNCFIDHISFKKPIINYFSSSFNKFIEDPEEIKKYCKKHLLKEVNWELSVNNLIALGYTDFVELGYSKILKGLLLDINKTVNIELSYGQIERVVEKISS